MARVHSPARRCFRTNAVPAHQYHHGRAATNQNQVCEHFKSTCVLQNPKRTGFKAFASAVQPIAIMTSGAFLYPPVLANTEIAAVSLASSIDDCDGQADAAETYQYRSVPKCLGDALDNSKAATIGWMLDGFAIRGYSKCGSRQCKSCYKLKAAAAGTHSTHYQYDSIGFINGTCDLDESNGKVFTHQWDGVTEVSQYAYVATSNYPYVPLGYQGEEWATISDDPSIGADGTNECFEVSLRLTAAACRHSVLSSPGAIVQLSRHSWHDQNLTSSSYQMLHELCQTRHQEPAEGSSTVGDACHCGGAYIDERNGPGQFGAAAAYKAM